MMRSRNWFVLVVALVAMLGVGCSDRDDVLEPTYGSVTVIIDDSVDTTAIIGNVPLQRTDSRSALSFLADLGGIKVDLDSVVQVDVVLRTVGLTSLQAMRNYCNSWGITLTVVHQTAIDEGVVLYGCSGDDHGYIENTNDYPVRVERVYQMSGEDSESMDLVEAHATLKIDVRICHQHTFKIYTMDGIYVGLIHADCPE